MTQFLNNTPTKNIDIESITEDLLNKVKSIKGVISTDKTQLEQNESKITLNASELDDLNRRLEKEINKDLTFYELIKTLLYIFVVFIIIRFFNK